MMMSAERRPRRRLRQGQPLGHTALSLGDDGRAGGWCSEPAWASGGGDPTAEDRPVLCPVRTYDPGETKPPAPRVARPERGARRTRRRHERGHLDHTEGKSALSLSLAID